MSNHEARMWIVGGIWCTATVGIAVWSVSAGAGVSTVALAVASCAAPLIVARLIGFGAPPPTVAEVLYAVNTPTAADCGKDH